MKKKILVTGSAGFIGFHTCDVLLRKGYLFMELTIILNIMT